MKKSLIPIILAGLLASIAGCGGSGSGGFIAVPKPIPSNRIAYAVAGTGANDVIISTALNGSDPQVHGLVGPEDTVWDVNSAGDRVLVSRLNSDGVTADAYSVKLDGTSSTRLTTVGYADIECLRYSPDYSKLICSGIDDTDEAVLVSGLADGSGQQIVYGAARVAQFGPGGSLVIGGELDDDVRTSYVGTMQPDGTGKIQLAKKIEPLGIDCFGAAIVYSASVDGDASGVEGLFTIPVSGGIPTQLFAPTGLSMDPKFSPDGRTVFFVREGIGVMSVSATGGVPVTVVSQPQILGLIRVR